MPVVPKSLYYSRVYRGHREHLLLLDTAPDHLRPDTRGSVALCGVSARISWQLPSVQRPRFSHGVCPGCRQNAERSGWCEVSPDGGAHYRWQCGDESIHSADGGAMSRGRAGEELSERDAG